MTAFRISIGTQSEALESEPNSSSKRNGAAQHVDFALDETEQVVARFAFAHDHLAAHVLGLLRDALDRVQPFETHAREQRDLSQREQAFHEEFLLSGRDFGRDARPGRREQTGALPGVGGVVGRRNVDVQRRELLVHRDRLE